TLGHVTQQKNGGLFLVNLNGDMCLDFVVRETSGLALPPPFLSSGIGAFINHCDGTFTEISTPGSMGDLPAITMGQKVRPVDLNGDGLDDLIVSWEERDTGVQTKEVWLNGGDQWIARPDLALRFPVEFAKIDPNDSNRNQPLEAVFTDVNGDGY